MATNLAASRTEAERELDDLLTRVSNPNISSKERLDLDRRITVVRGRVVRLLSSEARDAAGGRKDRLKVLIDSYLAMHKQQINQRMSVNHGLDNPGLLEDLRLHIQRLRAEIHESSTASNAPERVEAVYDVGLESATTAWSGTKIVLSGVLQGLSHTGEYIGLICTAPVNLLVFVGHVFYTTDLNPTHYNWQRINNIGRGLGRSLGYIARVCEQGIRRT